MSKRLRINIDFDNEPIIKKNKKLIDIPLIDSENIYISEKLINFGSFGLIFESFFKNKKVIVKVLKKRIPENHLYSLTKIYNSKFSNILKPIAISSCMKKIVFPYLEGESLNYNIYNLLTDKEKINQNMLNCIYNLHSLKIIHSDIKPNNFMLVNNNVILIDIDSCIPVIDNEPFIKCLYPQYGTIGFRKPNKMKINYNDDLWSLGATLYNLNTNKVPYEDEIENINLLNESSLIYKLHDKYYENNEKVDLSRFIDNLYLYNMMDLLFNSNEIVDCCYP